MQLESTEVINRGVEEVYALVKDDLPKLVPYLPNIKKIEQLKREEIEKGKIKIINSWFVNAELPSGISKFIGPDILSWKDTAHWNDEKKQVEYILESHIGNNLFEAKGVNYFKALGENKSELKVTCSIVLHPERIPGVPRLLANTVRPIFEKFIEKLLGPNLTSLGKGLNRYFDK